MPLQIRVRHALGERLMELPDRTVEGPVVVGRSSSCDVQIPSVNVAPRHCALFRHEGRWAVQALAGTTGTFIKGQPVTGPTFLHVGDVITIGSEATPPTIEVDPAAAAEGRTGWAGEHPASAAPPIPLLPKTPAARQGVPPQPARPVPHAVGAAVPAYGASSAAYGAPPAGFAQAAPTTGGWANAADGDTIDMSAWQSGSSIPYSSPSYRRRSQRTSVIGILIGLLLCGGIVAGAYWLIRHRPPPQQVIIIQQQQPATPVKPLTTRPAGPTTRQAAGAPAARQPVVAAMNSPPKTPPTDDTGTDDIEPKPTGPAAVGASGAAAPDHVQPAAHPSTAPADKPAPDTTAAVPPSTPPRPSHPDMADMPGGTADITPKPGPAPKPANPPRPHDPAMADDPAWAEMQDVITAPTNAALAVFRLSDYQRAHPGKHDAEIQQAMDRRFDQIWWERIDQLFKKRDRLTTDIAKKKKALWDETNPDEKKKGLEEVKQMETDLKKSGDILRKDMAYAADQPPDLANESQLAALAKSRPAPIYEAWKKTTLKSLQNNQGRLPWAADM